MNQDFQSDFSLPLAVDLDGTLVKTDTLVESILLLIKNDSRAALRMFLWLFKGKANFKGKIAARTLLQVEKLPYNEKFLNFLRQEKQRGRELILVTASPQVLADKINHHLRIFSQVFGSNDSTNLSGKKKTALLNKLYGAGNYAYAGNAKPDLKIWKEAAEAYLVHPSRGVKEKASRLCPIKEIFASPTNTLLTFIRAIRLHQWTKNILVLAPIFLATRLSDFNLFLILKTLYALFSFSLVSSSVYLLNDLLDIEADRIHPENKNRPFAAGSLPLIYGFIAIPVLLFLGAITALSISFSFFMVVIGYYILTMAYSIKLKQIVLVDIMILAFLYAWRLLAGAVAIRVELSPWFLAFSGFFFFSLALMKRCSELILIEKNAMQKNPRRGYFFSDLPQLSNFGISSGFISILVLALYINGSEQVIRLYAKPHVLLLICPFLLYWLARSWLAAHRGKMNTDPLVFALRDRVSYVMIIIMLAFWLIAKGVTIF